MKRRKLSPLAFFALKSYSSSYHAISAGLTGPADVPRIGFEDPADVLDLQTLLNLATDLSAEEIAEILDKIEKKKVEKPEDIIEEMPGEYRDVIREFFEICADMFGTDLNHIRLERISEFSYLCEPSDSSHG